MMNTQALREIARQIAADLPKDEILAALITHSVAVCNAVNGGYYELRQKSKKWKKRVSVGDDLNDNEADPVVENILGCMLQEAQSSPSLAHIHLEEDSSSTDHPRHFLGALVLAKQQIKSAIFVVSTKPFAPDQIAFLELAASFIEIMLHHDQILQMEREQRRLAEALTDTAAALNSALTIEKVLDRILIDLKRVVPHDGSHVMLLEEEVAQVVRCQGYAKKGLKDVLLKKHFSISEVPHLCHILNDGKPLAIPHTKKSSEWANLPEVAWIESYAGAPIRIQDKIVGFLGVDSATPGFFTNQHAQRLKSFTDQVAIALENARLYRALEQTAVTDELTGLLNRHGLKEDGQRELARSKRYKHPLAALLIDIDNFKDINDTFGHLVGDEVIQAVADHCRRFLRKTDVISRIGGDEIFVMLVETAFPQAQVLAERIQKTFSETKVATKQGLISVTLSVGLCEMTKEIEDVFSLLAVADRALYQAKGSGKNNVAILPGSINPKDIESVTKLVGFEKRASSE